MASKKQWLSVVAATALAASFTMTGCGSSGSSSHSSSSVTSASSESSVSSNASSSSVGPVVIKVSDAYVVEANVTAGTVEAINEIGNGEYEFNTSISGMLMAVGGANDLDGDGSATNADPKAPTLKAPEGYTNINPFTTMLVNGETDLNTTYPNAAFATTDSGFQFDFDVVAAGDADNNGSIDIAKETAKAALTLSGYQGDGNAVSSSSESSSSVSSEESTSSQPVIFPAAGKVAIDDPFPQTGPSSSSEAASSEDNNVSSSSEAAGGTAFAEIDTCTDNGCINDVVAQYMGELNGFWGSETSSSSEDSNASSSSEMSSEASTSSEPVIFPANSL